MRLLMLNPNTSESVTALIAAEAHRAAAPQTIVSAMTAQRGVPYIATRAEAVIGGAVTLEILAECHRDFDAVVIAAFGDPGLGGARELFPLPVIGLAEAGMLTACMLGRTFSIVTFASQLAPWYRECVEWHGLQSRCAGINTLEGSFASISEVQHEKESQLVRLALAAIERDGSDVVLLAGTPLAGLARRVADRIPVPVIDCVAAAVKQAEAVVALKPRKATAGTYRRPGAKTTTGLAPALAAWVSHEPME